MPPLHVCLLLHDLHAECAMSLVGGLSILFVLCKIDFFNASGTLPE